MRRGSHLAVADVTGNERTVYDVVLLAGSPRRYTLALSPDLVEGSVIVADGEQWTVADVRTPTDAPAQLICIYAL